MMTNEELDLVSSDDFPANEELPEESDESTVKHRRKRKSAVEESDSKEEFSELLSNTETKVDTTPTVKRLMITNCSDQALPLELNNGEVRWVSRGASTNISRDMVSVTINRLAVRGLITVK